MLNYSEMLKELLKEAAKEIGFKYDSGIYDLVAMELFNDYDIDLDFSPEGPANPKMLRTLADVTEEWKEATM